MNYLNENDINSRLLHSLSKERDHEDREQILSDIEQQNIALLKSKLKGRYDTDAIFSASAANRHWLIIKILTLLVVYDYVRRNAARKVPDDYRKDWEWAMKYVEKLKSGHETAEGLPPAKSPGQTANGKSPIYGNNTNNDLMI